MSLALRRQRKKLQLNQDLVGFLIIDPDTRQTIDGVTPANLARLWRWINASSQRQAAAVMTINVFCFIYFFFTWLGQEIIEWPQVIIMSLIIIIGWFLVLDTRGIYYRWAAES